MKITLDKTKNTWSGRLGLTTERTAELLDIVLTEVIKAEDKSAAYESLSKKSDIDNEVMYLITFAANYYGLSDMEKELMKIGFL